MHFDKIAQLMFTAPKAQSDINKVRINGDVQGIGEDNEPVVIEKYKEKATHRGAIHAEKQLSHLIDKSIMAMPRFTKLF